MRHAVYLYAVPCVGGRAEELCLEDRRSSCENTPVCTELFTTDSDRDVGSLFGNEEVPMITSQARQRRRPVLHVDRIKNGDVAAYPDVVVDEMIRRLQELPQDEITEAVPEPKAEVLSQICGSESDLAPASPPCRAD